MPRLGRALALVAALVVLALWLAPALLAGPIARRVEALGGGALLLEGVRPTFPWGFRAERAILARGDQALPLEGLAVSLSPAGARLDAQSGAGTILARTEGASRVGFVRIEALDLAPFEGLLPVALGLRGIADGMFRFGPAQQVDLTVRDGALRVRGAGGLELEFTALVVRAERDPAAVWTIDFADVRGGPLGASATGTIGAHGELALRANVRELEEPLRGMFERMSLPTDPLPYDAEISGSLMLPLLRRVQAEPR